MRINEHTVTHKKSTIAFFLDYENMQYISLNQSFTHCAESNFWPAVVIDALGRALKGTVSVRICYGDQMFHTLNRQHPALERLSPWERVKRDRVCQEALLATGFSLIHTPGGGGRKNFADITMALDCLERLGQNPRIDYVAIASQDSDFTPLFRKIKEMGKEPVLVTTGPVDSNARSMRHLRGLADCHLEYNQAQISEFGALTLDRVLAAKLEGEPKATVDGVTLRALEASITELRPGFAAHHLGYGSFREFLLANMPQEYNLVGDRLFVPVDKIAARHQSKRRDQQEELANGKPAVAPKKTGLPIVASPKQTLRKRESACKGSETGKLSAHKPIFPKSTQPQPPSAKDPSKELNEKRKSDLSATPSKKPNASFSEEEFQLAIRELSVIFNQKPRKRNGDR